MKKILLTVCLLSVMLACSQKPKINTDPLKDSFFEKTRLIMSKEEIEIYKHLPDSEAKEKFIDEFWKIRDPNPDTEENEIRDEFQERIDYANRWFNEYGGKGRGWDTERGRILLQIGFPDERYWGEVDDVERRPGPNYGRLRTTKRFPLEQWVFYRYQMFLQFSGTQVDGSDGLGKYRIIPVASELRKLRSALDLAKERLDIGTQKAIKDYFKYKADFKNGKITITIPVKRISFEEKEEGMNAEFDARINVYRDYIKVDEVHESKTVVKDKEELLQIKEISFTLPYNLSAKGHYFFDIVLTDKLSTSKYRNYCKFNH